MALWLSVLLAGLAVFSLRSPGGVRTRDNQRWLPWVLLGIPAMFFLLRAGLLWQGLLGMLGAAAVRQVLHAQHRRQGPAGGGGSAGAGSASSGARAARMSREEALNIFGLSEGASRTDVLREYRKLMKRLHPDVGGSPYLAAKLNEAREVLQ